MSKYIHTCILNTVLIVSSSVIFYICFFQHGALAHVEQHAIKGLKMASVQQFKQEKHGVLAKSIMCSLNVHILVIGSFCLIVNHYTNPYIYIILR